MNLLKINDISKYFHPLLLEIMNQKGTERKGKKFTDKEHTTAFVILMWYIFKNEKEVNMILKGTNNLFCLRKFYYIFLKF